jgi:hypothetical protein
MYKIWEWGEGREGNRQCIMLFVVRHFTIKQSVVLLVGGNASRLQINVI